MFVVFTLILIAIALLFVVPPLRGKKSSSSNDLDQVNLEATRQRLRDIEHEADNDLIASEHLESIREEAETTLLMEMNETQANETQRESALFHKVWLTIIVICIPVFAYLVYLSVGTPTAILQAEQQSADQSVDNLVLNLKQRLDQQPDDLEGWLILAKTSMVMQQFPQAVEAMENVYRLTGDTPEVLTRYADALTMANGGRFTTQSSEMVDKALQLEPHHTHGLWLAGMNAYQAEDYQTAVGFFQKARAGVTDAENLTQLDQLIVAASERAGLEVTQSQPEIAINDLMVRVDIDSSLTNQPDPNDTLFIFAKAAKGPPMPLAVSKHKASELPLKVILNDTMAMMPELKLSGFDQVIISARISKSDQPIAQTGDLQGESAIINPNQINEVNITIDQIIQ